MSATRKSQVCGGGGAVGAGGFFKGAELKGEAPPSAARLPLLPFFSFSPRPHVSSGAFNSRRPIKRIEGGGEVRESSGDERRGS